MIEDKTPQAPPPPIILPAEDPWAEWKPLWTNKNRKLKNKTTHDIQERHSPTEPVTVRLTATRSAHKSQRRIVDNRLWEAMSSSQQNAALQIALAFELMGRGLGYVNSNWQRIPGCKGQSNVSESHARLIQVYTEWAAHCALNKISHSLIIDILCFGHSCRTVDRDRRLKNGSARANLMQGLSLYCRRMGWPV
jgi:hypothetical protein